MHTASIRILAPLALCAAAAAQFPKGFITFSQSEQTLSGSGGTALAMLQPNETSVIEWGAPGCATLSAEKWAPRTCYSTMAGDANGDGLIHDAALFGSIDALACTFTTSASGLQNQRTVFWSVSAPMGTAVSQSPFRPGDVARIVRAPLSGDGQVEHLMRQEHFNQALGLPPSTPIDVDAFAFHVEFGVFFSLDADIVCTTACGPVLVQDGAVVCIPASALIYTVDFRVDGVVPNSAIVALSEPMIDAMVVAAAVTNRTGACVTGAVDLESLEFDMGSLITPWLACPTAPAALSPQLIFSVEAGTGASLLTTNGGGQIWTGPCAPMGAACGGGPTTGAQSGIRPAGVGLGAASWVNAFALDHTERYVLEPQNHVMSGAPAGAPAGANAIHIASPFVFNFVFLDLVSPVVPASIGAYPFSEQFFPDLYAPNLLFYMLAPAAAGFGSFPTPAIPPMFAGKVLFQSVGFTAFGTFELSTPALIDVQ